MTRMDPKTSHKPKFELKVKDKYFNAENKTWDAFKNCQYQKILAITVALAHLSGI